MESANTRVAHCMVCGNEWVPRDSTTKKPSRCSACRSRTVKWRDLLTTDELKAHDQYDIPGVELETPAPEPVEEVDETIVEEEPAEEDTGYILPDDSGVAFGVVGDPEPKVSVESIRRSLPSLPPQAYVVIIGALGALGLIFFLSRKAKKKHPVLITPPPEPQYTERDLKIIRQQQVDDVIRRRLAGGGRA